MGSNDINNKIKESLYHHNVGLDKDVLWANIVQQQARERRRMLLWVSLVAIILLSLGVYFFSEFTKIGYTNLPQASVESSEIKNTDIQNVNEALDAGLRSEIVEPKSNNIRSTLSLDDDKISPAAPIQIESEEKQSTATQTRTKEVLSTSQMREKTANLPFRAKEFNVESIDVLNASKLVRKELNPTDVLDLGEEICYTFKPKKHPWSIYAYGGPSVLIKNLTSNQVGQETYLSQRESSENALESLRAGLQAKYRLENGLYFKAGLEWSRFQERLTYTTSADTSYTISDQLIKIIVDSQGDSIPVYGDLTVTESRTRSWKVYNNYEFFNVPLHVGYERPYKRWVFSAELGAHINLAFKFDGEVLDPEGNPDNNPNYFRSNVGTSISASLGVGYQVLPRARVWLSPSMMKMLNPINVRDYPIDQNYTSIGCLFGLEVKI